MSNRVTAKQLVAICLGKEMSTTEIWQAVKSAHPANTMTRQELALRLRSMIRSPDVKITKKGCGPRALYKLTSVSDKFVERAEVNYRANSRTGTPDKTLWHFNSLEFWYSHKPFQANKQAECDYMYSALRRMQIRGYLPEVYDGFPKPQESQHG
ncbi:hypothetical protein [Serratia nevei]|uniref:hypothetical protein n=1 Tax=Serratia nevei TaxID=2703794 RepID=UPI003F7E84E1